VKARVRRVLVGAGLAVVALFAWWRWVVAPPVAPVVARAVYAACREGDVRRLAVLDAAGVSLAGPWTRPLLGVAAEAGQVGAMEYLVAHGASVNQPGKFSAPLELAVAAGRLDAARWLLDHGARTDVAGEELPLVTAVRSYKPELVRLLIARGAAPLVHADVELGVAAERGCARVEWLRAALR
jgi:hypothetical protein